MSTNFEPFKAVNWAPSEKIGEPKMDAMTDNSAWLFQNTPRAIYTLPGGIRRVEFVKIASGRVIVGRRNKAAALVEVRFGNFFSLRCEPNLTTGIISSGQPKVKVSLRGLGRNIPDHRGFRALVSIDNGGKKKKGIKKTMYVSWSAMGY